MYQAIETFIRENIQPAWHYLGTAKIAPREQNGVVDRALNVNGVKGLKAAGLPTVPVNVAADAENMALLVSEKAASFILADLGLEEKPVPKLSMVGGTNGVNVQ